MRILFLAVPAMALCLAACGNPGSLERPPPLWGAQPAPAAPPPAAPPAAAPRQEEEDDLFADEDERDDGRPVIPGHERFSDDDWMN